MNADGKPTGPPKLETLKPKDVTVTVLGAGIAGLTAAHELINRGFKVRVIERAVGPRPDQPTIGKDPLGGLADVDVGGMARSQWSTIPPSGEMARSLSGAGEYPLVDENGSFVYEDTAKDAYVAVRFDHTGEPSADEKGKEEDRIPLWCLKHKRTLQLVVLSYEDRRTESLKGGAASEPFWGPASALQRVAKAKAFFDESIEWMPATFVTMPIDDATFATSFANGQGDFPGLLVRVHAPGPKGKNLLPGEHGFRFFPGFYWHLRDTMKRTPVYDFSSDGCPVRTHRSVHDNLQEVQWQIMADPTRPFPTAFRRSPPSSVEEFLEQWQTLRNDLGFRDTDMLRFILRLGRFSASSRARRQAQYAHISWWDFLSLKNLDETTPAPEQRGGFRKDPDSKSQSAPKKAADLEGDFNDKHEKKWEEAIGDEPTWDEQNDAFEKLIDHERGAGSPAGRLKLGAPDRLAYGLRFRRALRHSPRALVAMDALVTDAYTQGLLATQLSMDQLGLNPMTDSTLNGPTSEAWFRHWRQYLADEGVKFIAGEVTSLDVESGRYTFIESPSGAERNDEPRPGEEENAYRYTICALDPTSVALVLGKKSQLRAASAPSALSDQRTNFEHTWSQLKDFLGGVTRKDLLRNVSTTVTRNEAASVWSWVMSSDPSASAFVEKYRAWAYDERKDDKGNASQIDPQHIGARGVRVDDRFQVLAGVQLYFERPTAFEHGHIYFAESPWGLMGISQLQHWRNWEPGTAEIRGNLSLVLGSWRAESKGLGDFAIRRLVDAAQRAHPFRPLTTEESVRTPWRSPGDLSRDQLAAEARKQVAWCRGTDAQLRRDLHVPETRFYHVDDYLQYRGGTQETPQWNLCPYLINLSGDWENRPPGNPWNPNRRDKRLSPPNENEGYRVYGDSIPLVFAGAHARTFTRMATMEAANESARHAVNSVLWHLSMRKEVDEFIRRADLLMKNKDDNPNHLLAALEGYADFLRWKSQPGSDTFDEGGLAGGGRGDVRPRDLPLLQTTWFGDFCEIRDHEDYEVPFFEFFRKVDSELFAAADDAPTPTDGRGQNDGSYDPYPTDGYEIRKKHTKDHRRPHLFDLLKLDAIPDRIDAGEISFDDAIRTLVGVGKALFKSLRGPEPVKAVLNIVDTLDGLVQTPKPGIRPPRDL